jgi:ubiquinone/menaquinone biosynthesis C-methylase UbiE/uncharacterized protein YbaR (Trm112 family)
MRNQKELEDILLCPLTQSELIYLSLPEVEALNACIELGEVQQYEGQVHKKLLTGALQVKGQALFYPIENDIVYLLPEAVLIGQGALDKVAKSAEQTKKEVKRFYDEIGWQQSEGIYQDAKDSEDLREVSKDYIEQCHLRVNQHLPQTGKYLLDVASGPIQYPAYLTYSQHYDYRICADISLTALIEAKKKLGDKGLYLLCDVTRLPLKNNVIDAVVSLHTLYHVPKEEQLTAFGQLHRVLKSGGKSVVIYSWGRHSLLMNILLFPWKVISLLKKTCLPTKQQALYFHAFNYRWFCDEIQAKYQTQLFSWRSVNVPFLQRYIHDGFFGEKILKGLFALEGRFHQLMGKIGAYPLFVTVKK